MSAMPVKITVIPNGPAQVEAEKFEITLTDGSTEVKEGQIWLCRCGKSKIKPYCDGQHKKDGFEG